jgi:hypothetical protein
MKKFEIFGVFVTVLAFNAVAVAGASATLWLKNGVSLTKEETFSENGSCITPACSRGPS